MSGPAEIIDPLLWRDAQLIIDRHSRPDDNDECVWCGAEWPCPPRQLADCAAAASSRPWRDSWAPRHSRPWVPQHELSDPRSLPRWRADMCRID